MVFNRARLWWYAAGIVVVIVTTLNITKGFFALQSYLPASVEIVNVNTTHNNVHQPKEGRGNVVSRFNDDAALHDAHENITEADLLYSSCLDTKCCFGGRKHHISYKSLYGSRKSNNINRSSDDSMNMATKKSEFFAVISRNNDDDDHVIFNETFSKYALDVLGIQQSDDASLLPVMYIPPIYNPAHCVQDLLFALLPMVYRGDINRNVIGVANYYPKDDYCIDILNALGWFHHLYEVPRKTCFDKLWVPAFMHYRYPRGLPRGLQVPNNGLYYEEKLPVEMIQFFQREMWRGLLNKNDTLPLDKEDDNNNNNNSNHQGMILLESRRTAKKRMLKDVDEIADMIRQKLPPDVNVYIVDDVGALSVREQAFLYHNATVIVAPHGGSNPNIIFMKPNTTVFEISCNGGSWAREWILDLGISHYPYPADEPECNDHNIKFLGVKPGTLADKVIWAFLQVHKQLDRVK